MRRPRRGFTLLEVIIAMGVSSVLFVVIWFFFQGLMGANRKTEDRLELNQRCQNQLERIARELQLAVEFTALRPDEITFRRPEVRRWKESGYEVNMDLSSRKFETVTYRRFEKDGGRVVALQRIEGMGLPEDLIEADKIEKEIFRGWVMPKGAEETPHEVPDMQVYRADRDVRSDLERIPLVRIRFQMAKGKDRIDILTKAFIPPIYAQIVQPAWNPG